MKGMTERESLRVAIKLGQAMAESEARRMVALKVQAALSSAPEPPSPREMEEILDRLLDAIKQAPKHASKPSLRPYIESPSIAPKTPG